MYYLAFVFLVATAIHAARLFVAAVARIETRSIRRAVFWLVVIPIGLALNLAALFLVGNVLVGSDMIFGQSPRYYAAVVVPPLVFLASLLWFACWGSRRQRATEELRARAWPVGRIAAWLGGCATLLVVSILLFDWRLKSQLRDLKANALATMESMAQPSVPDAENAAVVYEALAQWDELLTEVKDEIADRTEGVSGDDISFALVELDLLPAARFEESRAAFEVLRRGSALPEFHQPPGELDVIGMQESPETERLRTALRLFALNALLEFEHGDARKACDDVRVLLRIGTQLGSGTTVLGRANGTFARGLARRCVARMLRSDNRVSDDDLRSLVSEEQTTLDSVVKACRWEEAVHTVTLCNAYLDNRIFELADNPPRETIPGARSFGQMGLRLAHAQDDMIALKFRNDFYRPFAKRMEQSSVNVDEIADTLGRRIPVGFLQPTDSRDFTIYGTAAAENSRALVSLMAAATLFERRHGHYPTSVTDLVPEFLAEVPVSARDGLPFHLMDVEEGLVICCSEDKDEIQDALNSTGTIGPDTVKWLRATQCLGKAYDQAHGLRAVVSEQDE